MTEQGARAIWLLHAHESILPHECMYNTPTHPTCTLTHTTPQMNKPTIEAATMTSLGRRPWVFRLETFTWVWEFCKNFAQKEVQLKWIAQKCPRW